MNYPLPILKTFALECLVAMRSYYLKADTIIRRLSRRYRWLYRSDWNAILNYKGNKQ